MRTRSIASALAIAAVLVVSGCSSGSGGAVSTPTTTAPSTPATSASSSATAPAGPSDWFAPEPTGQGSSLVSVSCSDASRCLTGSGALWDGSAWTAGGASSTGASYSELSCTSAGFCGAIDSGDTLLTIGAPGVPTSGPNLDPDRSPGVLACAGTGFCLAAATIPATFVVYDGSWSAPAPVPGVTLSAGQDAVRDVSCSAQALCAVTTATGVLTYQKGTWSAVTNLDDEYGFDVACTPGATLDCLAVAPGRAFHFDGTSWTKTAGPEDNGQLLSGGSCPAAGTCWVLQGNGITGLAAGVWTRTAVSAGDNVMIGISCPTTTFCAAIDNRGSTYLYMPT